VFEVETFSSPDQPLKYHCKITTAVGAEFELVYDKVKMFRGGVVVSVEENGVEATDDGGGVVRVRCTTSGERVDIALSPKR